MATSIRGDRMREDGNIEGVAFDERVEVRR